MQFVTYLSVGFSVWVCQTDLWTLVSRAGCSRSGGMCVASLDLLQAPTVAAPLRQLVVLPLEHELEHRLAVAMKLFSDSKAVKNSCQNRSKVNGGGLRNVQD